MNEEKGMGAGDDLVLTPAAAAAEVSRTSGRVRRRARWPGLMWLTVGVAICGFFLATGSGDRLVSDVVGPLPLALGAVLYVLAARQPVVSQTGAGRIDKPLSYAFLATVVVGTIIKLTVLPERLTGWLVLLAVLMATPCLVGAWRWLRS